MGLPSYVYKGLGFFDADEIKDLLALLWYLADPSSDLRAAAFLRSRFVRLSDEGLRRLAPGLAAALAAPDPLPPAAPLDDIDAGRFAAARDLVRALAGARRPHAAGRTDRSRAPRVRLRRGASRAALGRRRARTSRNSGRCCGASRTAATPPSGASPSHLDRLAVGDESNASLDATNAVNLMTVHAAKGLEFPVVFVVNLARGTGNRRDYIRIGTEQSSGAASVAVGDFLSEYDEDAQAREREETKRLLYVALTRARDRLYLSSVREGRPHRAGPRQPGRGAAASASSTALRPRPPGRRPSGAPPPAVCMCSAYACLLPKRKRRPQLRCASATRSRQPTICCRLPNRPPPRRAAGDAASSGASAPAAEPPGQRVRSDARAPSCTGCCRRSARRVTTRRTTWRRWHCGSCGRTRPWRSPIVIGFAARAAAVYLALCRHPEVRRFYAVPGILHEVPFAFLEGDTVVRGTIDCLVPVSPGEVAVLEFKTGRPRPEHAEQLALYARVAASCFLARP